MDSTPDSRAVPLAMYEVSTGGGPIGSKVFPSAQTWLLDDGGKIKVERIVSYMVPRTGRAISKSHPARGLA